MSEAETELDLRRVFGRDFFDEDGIWTWEVSSTAVGAAIASRGSGVQIHDHDDEQHDNDDDNERRNATLSLRNVGRRQTADRYFVEDEIGQDANPKRPNIPHRALNRHEGE